MLDTGRRAGFAEEMDWLLQVLDWPVGCADEIRLYRSEESVADRELSRRKRDGRQRARIEVR